MANDWFLNTLEGMMGGDLGQDPSAGSASYSTYISESVLSRELHAFWDSQGQRFVLGSLTVYGLGKACWCRASKLRRI